MTDLKREAARQGCAMSELVAPSQALGNLKIQAECNWFLKIRYDGSLGSRNKHSSWELHFSRQRK
jgi:hypothetical protein